MRKNKNAHPVDLMTAEEKIATLERLYELANISMALDFDIGQKLEPGVSTFENLYPRHKSREADIYKHYYRESYYVVERLSLVVLFKCTSEQDAVDWANNNTELYDYKDQYGYWHNDTVNPKGGSNA